LNLKALELVSDGGCCTDETIGLMLSSKQHFVTHIEADTKWIAPIIEENMNDLLYGGEVINEDPGFTGMRFPVKHTFQYTDENTGRAKEITGQLNVFIYHSTVKAANDEKEMLVKFSRYKQDLLNNAVFCDDKKDFDSFCEKYMTISRDEAGNIISVNRKNENWKKRMRFNGFIVIIADREKNLEMAFEKYRARETVEENIKDGETDFGAHVTRILSEETINGQCFLQFECKTLRESFRLELNSIKRNLAVPNGNDEHDRLSELKKERMLREWLQKTSTADIMMWFDQLKQTVIKGERKEYEFNPDYIERDKMFLNKLGLYTGPL